LTELRLGGCENLEELSKTIRSISSLSILYWSYCKFIESLLTTFGDFKHLTKLLLQWCEKILRSLLKPLETSPHYQYWTYLIVSPLNLY
jgi:hypothetical protein